VEHLEWKCAGEAVGCPELMSSTQVDGVCLMWWRPGALLDVKAA
jgi:hypothetical protein